MRDNPTIAPRSPDRTAERAVRGYGLAVANDALAWDRLHDAVLVELRSSWESGDVIIRLRTGLSSAPVASVVGVSARRVEWSRTQPWGPSASVNAVRGPSPTSDREASRLEIELQSGDTLVLEAKELELAVL